MNNPERFPPDDPREWLGRARGSLTRARQRLPGVYLEDLCFDAQQAAEKALKAVLIALRVEFPYTHDLAQLLTLLQTNGVAVSDAIRQVARLSDYARIARYPSARAPVSESEYAAAIELAELAVAWAGSELANRSGRPDYDPGRALEDPQPDD